MAPSWLRWRLELLSKTEEGGSLLFSSFSSFPQHHGRSPHFMRAHSDAAGWMFNAPPPPSPPPAAMPKVKCVFAPPFHNGGGGGDRDKWHVLVCTRALPTCGGGGGLPPSKHFSGRGSAVQRERELERARAHLRILPFPPPPPFRMLFVGRRRRNVFCATHYCLIH